MILMCSRGWETTLLCPDTLSTKAHINPDHVRNGQEDRGWRSDRLLLPPRRTRESYSSSLRPVLSKISVAHIMPRESQLKGELGVRAQPCWEADLCARIKCPLLKSLGSSPVSTSSTNSGGEGCSQYTSPPGCVSFLTSPNYCLPVRGIYNLNNLKTTWEILIFSFF